MLFSNLYKIMVNKATFVGFIGGDRSPLDPPLFIVKLPIHAILVIAKLTF